MYVIVYGLAKYGWGLFIPGNGAWVIGILQIDL